MNFPLRLCCATIAWLIVAILVGSIAVALIGVAFGIVSQYAALLIESYMSITGHDING